MPLIFFLIYDKNNTDEKHNNTGNTAYFGLYMSGLLLAIQIAFSVITTHDYLSWNRTRWEAIRDLNEVENIPLENIDGGLEFNGLYFYDAQYQAQDTTGIWWWTGERDYIISFNEIPDFEITKQYEYSKFINQTQGKIFVLKRK